MIRIQVKIEQGVCFLCYKRFKNVALKKFVYKVFLSLEEHLCDFLTTLKVFPRYHPHVLRNLIPFCINQLH